MVVCEHCGGEMLTVTGCDERQYQINGEQHEPVRVDTSGRACHDCGALDGQFHHPGCDMERCPACEGQLITCGHVPVVAV